MKKFLFSPGNHTLGSSVGLLFLRIGMGLVMLLGHGLGKWAILMDSDRQFGAPSGLGSNTSLILVILAELVCAAAIVIGFMTRLATIPLIITMLVAAFVVHANDPWFIANAEAGSKELALLFLAGFAAIFFTGPGRYSADGLLVIRKRKG